MIKNNTQFLIENEKFNPNFEFPFSKDISTNDVINIYENFKKIFPYNSSVSKEINVRNRLKNIINDFDVLLLDAFGVINVGNSLIPGIIETLNEARDKGVVTIILTNGATFCSEKKINQFHDYGLDFSYDEIVSSRDVTERFLSMNHKPSNIGVLGNKDKDLNIQNSNTINLEKNIEIFDEVDSFVFLGTSSWDTDYQEILKASLLSKPRPFFVSNPDIVAPHNNYFSIEPAYFTFRLINDGVNLPIWFGKPFSTIFEIAFEKISNNTGKPIDLSRIGMVGDSLHTDILGANSVGIKSILMTKFGLLKEVNVPSLIKKTNIIPDYIVEAP